MPGDGSGKYVTIRMPDEATLKATRTILAYEASVRGCKRGQALAELVMEAADVDSYPPEVRARLREIGEAASRKSVERFLGIDGEADG